MEAILAQINKIMQRLSNIESLIARTKEILTFHKHTGIDGSQLFGANGGISGIQVFTSSGVFSPPSGITKFWVRMLGGGQGGGFASTSNSVGTAGASGDYVEAVVSVSGGISVTIGAFGAGAVSAGSGANGGDTSFGTLAVAKGGNSSTTSVGDLIISSMTSLFPSLLLSAVGASTSNSQLSAAGGSNPLGFGAPGSLGSPGSQANGGIGQGYGTGGSGGASGTAGGTAAGGDGKKGLCIIMW